MDVQAQYPSNINIFLLNSGKNGQEGHDYSLQPQTGLNQSHMLFNTGATSSRKRGREAAAAGVSQTAPNVVNPLFSLQSHSPQLIDLTQLHNHQQNAVSTGLSLSFGQQLHNQRQHRSHSSPFLSLFPEGLNSQIKQHRDEIDQFLQAQGEQLRRALTEKRQRHYRELLNAADESISRRLREKEAELEIAMRRNAELHARAAQLSVEAQVWQAKVKAHEATAASLQAQLQHTIMMNHVEDDRVLLCAVGVEGQAEDAESAYVDPDRVTVSGPKCRGCDTRVASVVVLPCRHLCMCTECDKHFRACPVCLTVKNSSIGVCHSANSYACS